MTSTTRGTASGHQLRPDLQTSPVAATCSSRRGDGAGRRDTAGARETSTSVKLLCRATLCALASYARPTVRMRSDPVSSLWTRRAQRSSTPGPAGAAGLICRLIQPGSQSRQTECFCCWKFSREPKCFKRQLSSFAAGVDRFWDQGKSYLDCAGMSATRTVCWTALAAHMLP